MAKAPFSSRIDPDLRTEFEIEMRRRGIRVVETALDQAIRLWMAQTGHASLAETGDPPLTGFGYPKSIPPKDLETRIGDLPDEVLSLVRNHWDDPNCKECVLAIARIWDVGDPEIMDSLARNCKTFRRASEMVEALRESARNPDSRLDERRIIELLSLPRASQPKTRGGKGGS